MKNNTCEQQVLLNHERIEIGEVIQFRLNLFGQQEECAWVTEDQETATERIQRELKDEKMTDKNLKNLTAAELVELIEQEQKVVEEYEQQRQSEAASLLKVIHSLADKQKAAPESTEFLDSPISIPLHSIQPKAAASVTSDSAQVEQELHCLVEELSELVGELCTQVEQFSHQDPSEEPGHTIAFRNLVNEQHAILEQLDTISELIKAPARTNRKIA